MVEFKKLEELRTRKEVEDYFKKLGKNITDEELTALKQSYEKAQKSSSALTMQQLDDVAGGGFAISFNGEILHRSDTQYLGKVHGQLANVAEDHSRIPCIRNGGTLFNIINPETVPVYGINGDSAQPSKIEPKTVYHLDEILEANKDKMQVFVPNTIPKYLKDRLSCTFKYGGTIYIISQDVYAKDPGLISRLSKQV